MHNYNHANGWHLSRLEDLGSSLLGKIVIMMLTLKSHQQDNTAKPLASLPCQNNYSTCTTSQLY